MEFCKQLKKNKLQRNRYLFLIFRMGIDLVPFKLILIEFK